MYYRDCSFKKSSIYIAADWKGRLLYNVRALCVDVHVCVYKNTAPMSLFYCGASPMHHFRGLVVQARCSIDVVTQVRNSAQSRLYRAKLHAPVRFKA